MCEVFFGFIDFNQLLINDVLTNGAILYIILRNISKMQWALLGFVNCTFQRVAFKLKLP